MKHDMENMLLILIAAVLLLGACLWLPSLFR